MKEYSRPTRAASYACLSGGEDYELLFTAPEKNSKKISALSKRLKLRMTPSGVSWRRKKAQSPAEDGSDQGKESGFDHFKQKPSGPRKMPRRYRR
jgi:thiamine monophosphate kinase